MRGDWFLSAMASSSFLITLLQREPSEVREVGMRLALGITFRARCTVPIRPSEDQEANA